MSSTNRCDACYLHRAVNMSTKMKQVAGSLQSLSAQLTTATTDMHLMTTGQHALSANMGSLATALAQQLVVQNQMLTRLLALEGQFVALQTEVKDRSLKIEGMAQTLIEQKLHGHNLEASNRAAAPNAAAAPAATAGAPTAVHPPTDAAPAGAAATALATTAAAGDTAASTTGATAEAAHAATAVHGVVALVPLPVQPAPKPLDAFKLLVHVPSGSTVGAPTTLKGMSALTLFSTAWTSHKGDVPATMGLTIGDKGRAKQCLQTLNALLTTTEKQALLKPDNGGDVQRLSGSINAIAAAWLAQCYKDKNKEVPKLLQSKGQQLKVSSFEDRFKDLGLTESDRVKLYAKHAPDFRASYDRQQISKKRGADQSLPSTSKLPRTVLEPHEQPAAHEANDAGNRSARNFPDLAPAQQVVATSARKVVPSSTVTSFRDCSHNTRQCKATNTPCSQCSLLVCSECALVISGGDVTDVTKGYVCPAHLQNRTCAYRLGTCQATLHKCKEPGCGLPVCSICAARISFTYPPNGYWCQTHANTLSTTSNIIYGPQSSAAAQSKRAV